MIVYNITVKVDAIIAPKWLLWLYQTHAPEILGTGCFVKYGVLQLLETDDSDGPTYAVQFYAHTTADYEKYRVRFAALHQQEAINTWGSRFVSLSTLMQVIA